MKISYAAAIGLSVLALACERDPASNVKIVARPRLLRRR
jgi:hypothetical protein